MKLVFMNLIEFTVHPGTDYRKFSRMGGRRGVMIGTFFWCVPVKMRYHFHSDEFLFSWHDDLV